MHDELFIELGGGSDLPDLNQQGAEVEVRVHVRGEPEPRVVLVGSVREWRAGVEGSRYWVDLANPPLKGGR